MKMFSNDLTFEVSWKPFFLNPNTSDAGIPLLDYLARKYGAQAARQASSGDSPLSAAGRNVGIEFNPNRRIVNTLKSHCMLDYAKLEGKQNLVAENLFSVYFQEGKDINSVDVLSKVAADSGLGLENMEKHMKDSTVVSRVREEAMEALDQGVNGVPYFNIQLKGVEQRIAAFSGAQPPETFVKIFHRLLARLKSSV